TLTGTDFDVVGSDTITVAADSVSVAADSIGNSQLEFDTGQALTTTSDVTFADLTLTSLTIGTVGLADQGTDNTTSGASVVGVYDEFTNSSSTTIQGVLNDLDSAISGAAHDAVTLVTSNHDYLSLADQAITPGTIDISDDTNLTAGDHLTLTGDDLAVDDDFLLNTGDTASGTYTFTGTLDLTGTVLQGATALVAEGTTADDFETSIAITNPTQDRTITFPDATGEVTLLGQSIQDSEVDNDLTISSSGTVADGALSSNVSLLGTSIEGSEITNGTIEEIDLEATNTATDNYTLTY